MTTRSHGAARLSRVFRYVFREILSPTVLGLAIYTFVLLMNAIFNVADASISVGVAVLAVLLWLEGRHKKAPGAPAAHEVRALCASIVPDPILPCRPGGLDMRMTA